MFLFANVFSDLFGTK